MTEYQPHSIMAEQALLGLLMLDNTRFKAVGDLLPVEEFYVPINAAVYRAIGELISARLEANPITLREKMRGSQFDDAQLNSWLAGVFESATLATDANSLAFVIAECAYQRRLIGWGKALTDAVANNKPADAKAVQEAIANEVVTFSKKSPDTPTAQIQRAYKKATSAEAMMQTGFPQWDEAFGGLFAGSRYIIAGHGGVGKSALAINMAWNLAKSGKRVRWLTFEEEPEQVWWRIFARETDTPITSFRKGLTERQQAHVAERQEALMGHDFMIFANARDVGEMINWCGKCDCIVIDGMTSAPAPGAQNKVDKAGIVTEYCKKLADATGACVIILAHVNSDSIKTGSSMTGIYGGQAATFDPEGIIDLRFADANDNSPGARCIKMHVLKNRYGEAGRKCDLWFIGEKMRYV
jgi:predicted ATP-dependent serine protease